MKTNPIKTENLTEKQWWLYILLVKREEITEGKKPAGQAKQSRPHALPRNPAPPLSSKSGSATENIKS